MSAKYNFEQRKVALQALVDTAIQHIEDYDNIVKIKSMGADLLEMWGVGYGVIPVEEENQLSNIELILGFLEEQTRP